MPIRVSRNHIRPAIMFQILFCNLTWIFSLFYGGLETVEVSFVHKIYDPFYTSH